MKSLSFLVVALGLVVVLSGCPDTGIVCSAGTVRCGQGCVDTNADAKNCSACGNACRSGQVCNGASCVCSAGTVACEGECVVRETDPKNCGGCGIRCAEGEVCQASTCKLSCSLSAASTLCGNSCVDLTADPRHCGGCGVVCENSQSCRQGRCTYDLVVACFGSGQVVGLQRESEFRGPAEPLGTGPQSLASLEGVLLALDGIDKKLYQAQLNSVGGHAFAKFPNSNSTGSAPYQVIVAAPYVYITNSVSGTLQILRNLAAPLSDGGAVADGGLALVTIAELPLGPNTFPQGVAKVGDDLWIPLLGGVGAATAAAGQKVVRVNVANPNAPMVRDTINLSDLDLKPFAGRTSVARPEGVVGHRGSVYVVLSNLHPDTYAPEGPGLLAKINIATNQTTLINLGADKCLNPGWLASDGVHLLVGCRGAVEYDLNYAVVKTSQSGVVLLDENDVPRSTWEPRCPPGADGGCRPILLSRFAISGNRAYVGDQNGGRVFVLDITDNLLHERRGYFGDAGMAIAVCPSERVTGIANVSDVFAVP